MSFSEALWSGTTSLFDQILAHPFLTGLTDGTLPEDAFRAYVIQDSHYLATFGRSIAILAARSDGGTPLQTLCAHAGNSVAVEQALHATFLTDWGLTAADIAATEPSPTTLLYRNTVLATVCNRPFHEGLAAILPCYRVYLEVGRALVPKGSPNPLYQRWIDTYAGDDFATVVDELHRIIDATAPGLSASQLEAMHRHHRQGVRFEWMFWDAAWRKEAWPI